MEWKAAYYPETLIENPRTRVIMALLFDKVICHFPVASTGCGGGLGMGREITDNDILVKEGIFEIEENLIPQGEEGYFTFGHNWGDEEEFTDNYQLQVTAMAMNCCKKTNAIPVTDSMDCPIPILLMKTNSILRNVCLQAGSLSTQTIEIPLPLFNAIPDYEILKARENLKEELIPFRRAMIVLAPILRNSLVNNVSLPEIHKEAKYIVETKVLPTLDELRERLEKEKGKRWRRLLMKGAKIIPTFALNWAEKSVVTAAVNAVRECSDLAMDSINKEFFLDSMLKEGGLGFLISLEKHLKVK